jgi:hypothetical protein
MLVVPPQRRKREIGEHEIEECDGTKKLKSTPPVRVPVHSNCSRLRKGMAGHRGTFNGWPNAAISQDFNVVGLLTLRDE